MAGTRTHIANNLQTTVRDLQRRKARGRRHRLVTVLGIAVAAVLAGARCYVAIEPVKISV